MTEELKEVGVDVGHRRVGLLMRENGIVVERTRKFKATTVSDHNFNIAANLLDRDFTADQLNQKWAGGEVELHRFRSGLLRAILAIKETGYGSDTQRQVSDSEH
jgi:transposase InsO family protein